MTREEAIDCLNGLKIYLKTEHIDQEAIDMAIEALQREEHLVELEAKAVAIIKSERHGENISENGFLCSVCSFGDFGGFHGYEPNYCPNCGAKMDEEKE